MYEQDILITDADHRRLRWLVGRLRASGRARARHVGALATRIRRSVIVSPKEIPRNVVTLNSRVYLKDLDSRKRLECTLSDPFDISAFGDRLSVAGPAGIALLGKRVGQIVRWAMGPRERRFRIEQIAYQPEAAGDFHL
jgi:regulator of nucleoside diphosphate kinase